MPMLSQVIPYWEMRADGRAQIGMEGGVTAFMSTITSKIDAKGRVSVPSVFRSAIAAQNGDVASPHGIFVYPSFTENAIEGGGQSLMNDIGAMVDRLDLFTEERDALATSLFADSHHLTFDVDGRVSLPETLLAHANIDKSLCFVGLAGSFRFGILTVLPRFGPMPAAWRLKSVPCCVPCRHKPARREFGSVSGGGCNQRQPARMPPTSAPHIPVLLSEVVTAIAPAKGDVYLDGTFGAGGYTRAVLEAAGCSVLALDRDPQALADAGALVDAFGARLTLVEGCFGDMEALAQDAGFAELDGVMLDLGVSSMQLDQPARGFSFMRDGPLDMRMGATGTSAEDLLMKPTPPCSVSILSVYGEERRARAIVRALVVRRETARITRTGELAEIVCSVLGQPRGKGAHPATRTFQALRIYLNDELGNCCAVCMRRAPVASGRTPRGRHISLAGRPHGQKISCQSQWARRSAVASSAGADGSGQQFRRIAEAYAKSRCR